MSSRKRGVRAIVLGLVVTAGLALAPAAFARSHYSVGIGLPGVSLGYSNGGRFYGHGGFIGVGGFYGPAYYPGYYAPYYPGPAYYGRCYARPFYDRAGYYHPGYSYSC